MTENPKKKPCTARYYEITESDLPLSCPTKDMRIWDGHPRVYLPIEQQGHAQCPYCGANFYFKDHSSSS